MVEATQQKDQFYVQNSGWLAERVVLSQDEKEPEKQKLELKDEGPLETVTWRVTPSKDLMRLYREAISRSLRERDTRLSCKFLRRF